MFWHNVSSPRVKLNYYKQKLKEGNYFLSKLFIRRWTRKMRTEAKKPNFEF